MKNQDKDAENYSETKFSDEYFSFINLLKMKKLHTVYTTLQSVLILRKPILKNNYFTRYITSFTS
jgi:hypothetical protein